MTIQPGDPDRPGRRPRLTRRAFWCGVAGAPRRCRRGLAGGLRAAWRPEKEVLPKHVTPETIRAVLKGLDYLAAQQAEDGSWITGGGEAYPVAMTGLAGTAILAHGNSPSAASTPRTCKGAVEFLVAAHADGADHRSYPG